MCLGHDSVYMLLIALANPLQWLYVLFLIGYVLVLIRQTTHNQQLLICGHPSQVSFSWLDIAFVVLGVFGSWTSPAIMRLARPTRVLVITHVVLTRACCHV